MEQKKDHKPTIPELKTTPLNELSLKVTGRNEEVFIDEEGNTVVCLLMQQDGKVMTSFLGDYNKTILNTLDKVLRSYFKDIKKQLLGKKPVSKQAKEPDKKVEKQKPASAKNHKLKPNQNRKQQNNNKE